jgi:hypothetical protein
MSVASIGALVVVAVLSTAASGKPPDGATVTAQAQQIGQPPIAAPTSGAGGQMDASYLEPNCAEPKSQTEADYCIQAQMALATKDQVDIANRQTWFSLVEAALLFLTLLCTVIAAWQSAVAAKDSEKGMQFAAKSAEASAQMAVAMMQWVDVFHAAARAQILVTASAYDMQERSIFDQVAMTAGGGSAKITGTFRYENTGATAARFTEVSVALTLGPDEMKPAYGGELLAPGAGIWNRPAGFKSDTFPIHSKTSMSPDEARQVLDKNLFVWLCGRIVYLDLMGKPHESQFCRRLNVDMQDFQLGPAEFNQTT